jgi:23S rRNA (cytidine1920-2'-O)/16S rRNA (cytidine1409-2'-O)-methyltransferase
MKAPARRLDQRLADEGRFESRARASAAIYAGLVTVRLPSGRSPAAKPGLRVPDAAEVTVTGKAEPFVSRGGRKLAGALDAFGIRTAGRSCLDVGASTGGFTDCLLSRGATGVVSVDVGHGQLDPKLRNDPRVISLERTDIRDLAPDVTGRRITLATVDVSFIPLRKVLPSIRAHLAPGAEVVVLVKPQFEVGPARVGKGGIVKDGAVRASAVADVTAESLRLGYEFAAGRDSDVPGRDGNF